MDIKITFDATPAFMEAINGLAKALTPQSATNGAAVNGTSKKANSAKTTAQPGELVEVVTGNGESGLVVTGEIDDAPTGGRAKSTLSKATLEQVRAAVQRQSKDGKTAQIKVILAEFGAEKVPNLKPEQYADFLTKVEAL